MDWGEAAGVRDISYPDPLPDAAAVPANGTARTVVAPRLEFVRHGHAVFRPKHMSPEELEHGHAWIWRRRPADWVAVAPYLAMAYLYKKSNRFWRLLIKYDLVNAVWRPLVELTRVRHVRFREELARREVVSCGGSVGAAGV